MLTYFPRFLSVRAIICYVATLAVVSAFFMSYAMPFQFVLFGLVSVVVFFNYSNKLTISWQRVRPTTFRKKLFTTAFIIRAVYVVFIYFYYIEMTGAPHMYHPGDELFYELNSDIAWYKGLDAFASQMKDNRMMLSDSGYFWWLAIEKAALGPNQIPYRLVKCLLMHFLVSSYIIWLSATLASSLGVWQEYFAC